MYFLLIYFQEIHLFALLYRAKAVPVSCVYAKLG